MSQKENSQKVVLTQIQNQAIIVSSQGEVKSQCQAQSQDGVPSQVRDSRVSRCVASQSQALSQPQLASQNNVSSQSTVASQGHTQTQSQLASQQNDSSQDNVVTQPPLAATVEAGKQNTASEDQDAKQKTNE